MLASLVMSSPACSSGSRAERAQVEGVSAVTYAPHPLYNDQRSLKVRFTTRGRARPGLEYYAGIVIHPGRGERTCSFLEASPSPESHRYIDGSPGKTYTVVLRASAPAHRFCAGRGTIAVGTARPSDGTGGREYRTLAIRVLRRS